MKTAAPTCPKCGTAMQAEIVTGLGCGAGGTGCRPVRVELHICPRCGQIGDVGLPRRAKPQKEVA